METYIIIFHVHDDSIMSYLIALYVYYHGNNLSVFGINKGATDDQLNNKGLRNVTEINPELVDPNLIKDVAEREAKEAEADMILNYNEMMKEAQRLAQQESFKMHKAGIVENEIFNNTQEVVMDEDYGAEIPLDIFSTLNGF